MPHVFSLDGCEIHVLPDVIIGLAYAERLQLLLSLQVILGDLPLDDVGADLDLLVDLLLGLILDLLDDLLDLGGLDGLLLEVVRPLGENLQLACLWVRDLQNDTHI